MPRTLTDLFNEYPEVEIIDVVGYDNGGQYGLSSDGRNLKIHDADFAKQLAALPLSNTDGHLTDEGYYVRGGANIISDAYKARVYRRKPYC